MDVLEQAQALVDAYQQALDAFNAAPSYVEQNAKQIARQTTEEFINDIVSSEAE